MAGGRGLALKQSHDAGTPHREDEVGMNISIAFILITTDIDETGIQHP
jgi:hypothetical protein